LREVEIASGLFILYLIFIFQTKKMLNDVFQIISLRQWRLIFSKYWIFFFSGFL